MKYINKRSRYEAANLNFDPVTMLGHSYGWYEITKKIGDTVFLNTYRYSVTTAKHAGKLRKLLNELGIKFTEIQAPKGLQSVSGLNEMSREKKRELANERKRFNYALKKKIKAAGNQAGPEMSRMIAHFNKFVLDR